MELIEQAFWATAEHLATLIVPIVAIMLTMAILSELLLGKR